MSTDLPPGPDFPPGKPRRRVGRFVRSQLEQKSFGDIAVLIKGAAIAIATLGPAILATIVVTQAMLETGVVMTSLRVPQSYELVGFTGETATQRLLDEIAELNRASIAAKPKTNVGDTQIFDALSQIETPSGNLDLKSIQSLIQRVLGKKIVQVSGEITVRKEGEIEWTRLRLRQTPGRETLIDYQTTQGPEDLFKRSALNLLEHIDPEIAAGIYWREYGDQENAARLIEIALTSNRLDAEKYAWNLKSYMLATQGKFDDALAASQRARDLDPLFVAPEYSKAFSLSVAKRHDEALVAAQRGVERDPGSTNSHYILGIVLSAMDQKAQAIEAFREAIRLDKSHANSRRQLASLLRDVGQNGEASKALFEAVAVVPGNPGLQFDYAEDLRRRGRLHDALKPLRRANAILPDHVAIMVSLAEAEMAEGRLAEGVRLAVILRNRIAAGEKLPPGLQPRIDALIAAIPKPSAGQAATKDSAPVAAADSGIRE